MKLHTYAFLAAAAACGLASAQTTAYTTPVGYETINLAPGTNTMGVRLHNPVVVAGVLETISATQMTDLQVDFDAVLTGGASTFYIVEFLNDSGVIQEVTGASGTNSTLTLVEDITASVSAGARYQIRAASTLASIFGATNSAGLTPGFSGPTDADIISVPDGAGGFFEYFYDEDNSSWANAADNSLVDGSTVPLVYTDGLFVFTNAPETLTVSGEIVKDSKLQGLASGFNNLGSVFPVGATLDTMFGSNLAVIHPGFSGPTDADIVYVPNGAGFDEYFYDEDNSSWARASDNSLVDPTSVSLPSGLLYFNAAGSFTIENMAPAAYSTL